jgi:hypothetical protein
MIANIAINLPINKILQANYDILNFTDPLNEGIRSSSDIS